MGQCEQAGICPKKFNNTEKCRVCFIAVHLRGENICGHMEKHTRLAYELFRRQWTFRKELKPLNEMEQNVNCGI